MHRAIQDTSRIGLHPFDQLELLWVLLLLEPLVDNNLEPDLPIQFLHVQEALLPRPPTIFRA